MGSRSYTEKSMEYLIESLAQVQVDHCSDEFLITLNKLIAVCTKLSVVVASKQEEAKRRKRHTSNVSSTSDDVRCVSADVDTVQVDSDSEESVLSIGSSNPNASTSSEVQSETLVEVTAPSPRLKRVSVNELNELAGKRCELKLRRVDETLASMRSQIQNDNSAAGPSSHKEKMPSNSVTVSFNKNFSDVYVGKSVGQYTYQDYYKRYRDVCSVQ